MAVISGRCIPENIALALIKKGEFATSRGQAVSKFGLEYILISPLYPRCQKLLEQICSPDELNNCCYVHKPAKLM